MTEMDRSFGTEDHGNTRDSEMIKKDISRGKHESIKNRT